MIVIAILTYINATRPPCNFRLTKPSSLRQRVKQMAKLMRRYLQPGTQTCVKAVPVEN